MWQTALLNCDQNKPFPLWLVLTGYFYCSNRNSNQYGQRTSGNWGIPSERNSLLEWVLKRENCYKRPSSDPSIVLWLPFLSVSSHAYTPSRHSYEDLITAWSHKALITAWPHEALITAWPHEATRSGAFSLQDCLLHIFLLFMNLIATGIIIKNRPYHSPILHNDKETFLLLKRTSSFKSKEIIIYEWLSQLAVTKPPVSGLSDLHSGL